MIVDKQALRRAAQRVADTPLDIEIEWRKAIDFMIQITPNGVLSLLDEIDTLKREKLEAADRAHDAAVDLERQCESHAELRAEIDKLRATSSDLGEKVQAFRELRQYQDALRESVGHASWAMVVNELRMLRQDHAERDACREAIAAVAAEVPYRITSKGSAPGHSHSEPGVWDSDNGELAGKPCAWCRVWALAKSMAGGKA